MDATAGARLADLRKAGARFAARGAVVAALVASVVGPGGPVAAGAGAAPVPATLRAAPPPVAAAAQPVSQERPSIAVLGVGEASAPAVSGRIQLILRAVDPFAALPQGEPVPASGQPPALTAAQLRPVAAAVAAAGATTRRVEVHPGPVVGGPFGPGAAQILVDLNRTTLPLADELVAAAVAAAGANGLFVESVGGGFEPADCDGLLGEAREAAAADARRRAEGVAAAFGVEAGDLLLASEAPFYDGGGGFGCGTLIAGSTQGGTYFPPFDPSVPPTVQVYAQINASYAIVER